MVWNPLYGPTAFADFVHNIAAMGVAGVVKDFGLEPPMSLKTAQLPAKFIGDIGGDRSPFTFCFGDGSGMMTVQLIIAIEPVVQGQPEHNREMTIAMIDNLVHAVGQADLATSKTELSVRQAVARTVAGETYWAVAAELTARG